jgi:hypothetical protein
VFVSEASGEGYSARIDAQKRKTDARRATGLRFSLP